MVLRYLLVAAILALPCAAAAEGEAKEDEKLLRDHAKQGFVNVGFGTGFYLVAPKEKNNELRACGTKEQSGETGYEGEPICVGRSSAHLEFLGGYGVLPRFEVFAIFRLGLEAAEPGRTRPLQVGAGVKVYSPADGLFKIGIGIAPLFDFSQHATPGHPSVDFGYDFVIHVPIQFQFDIVRWVGVYAELAPNISFITEFRLDISAGIGVQGRFP
jgi:hypothetical protein